MIGGNIILALADSDRYVKLQKEDVERIEKSAGKPTDQMTEQELDVEMKQLDIKEFELTPEDRSYIDAQPKLACPACGAPLRGDENFCGNCGITIPS